MGKTKNLDFISGPLDPPVDPRVLVYPLSARVFRFAAKLLKFFCDYNAKSINLYFREKWTDLGIGYAYYAQDKSPFLLVRSSSVTMEAIYHLKKENLGSVVKPKPAFECDTEWTRNSVYSNA